ncbi:dephospho-CoA kinase [Paenirhodobacter populi]|uniref:dephospho-CoA kinase n=1 Tax=Paenirhodobacter populi TaxID=2306993 RepID=UPI000FE3C42E|nr:dephospho-CoA kinase [Sinirhodobacter populi]RWR11272.1 dephospho-CoA kinase [Sinirhodobacter populi]
MSRPFLLGLTGSIGMGKSTTAQMFADEGIPVWDADATVHALYARGGAAVAPIAAAFPEAVVNGAVDRGRLRAALAAEKGALARLESIVHPLTTAARQAFIAAHADADLILLDIPLLYETGADAECDAVLVVTAAPEVQRDRVLARGTMTGEQLDLILSRQMPDARKRALAHHVIETHSLDETRAAVRDLIRTIRSRHA